LSTYSQPSAPGANPGPGTPSPTTPGTAPAESPSPPGGGAQQPFGGGPMMLLVMLLPILLIFMTMRGQNKKQKQVESSLKTGDTVVTQSGLIGKVTEFIGETRVKIEIAPGVNVRMLKSAISGVDAGETKPSETKDAKEKPQEKKA
jgi:preprotein translocase subunit YajC